MRRDWARVRPVMPAPMMRTGRGEDSGEVEEEAGNGRPLVNVAGSPFGLPLVFGAPSFARIREMVWPGEDIG